MEESLEPSIVECTLVSYHGDTDEVTGFYNGWGEARYQNGCLYEGTFKAGLFHGTGKYTWADSSQFEGEFVEGMICGRGKFIWASGSKYEGTVVDGKRHGTGQYTSAEGQLYDGEWVDGMRDGKGKMYYNADKSILYVVSRVTLHQPIFSFIHQHVFLPGILVQRSPQWPRYHEICIWQYIRGGMGRRQEMWQRCRPPFLQPEWSILTDRYSP